MRTSIALWLAIVSAPGLLSAQQKSTSVTSTLEKLEREYVSVQTITDSARGRRLVEPGALIMNPDGSTITGEDMLRQGWSGEAVFDSLTVDFVMVRQLG